MVKRCMQIVQRVADDGRSIGWQVSLENATNRKRLLVRVFVNFNSVWIVADKRLKEIFKISDVTIRPRDFEFGAKRIKCRHGHPLGIC